MGAGGAGPQGCLVGLADRSIAVARIRSPLALPKSAPERRSNHTARGVWTRPLKATAPPIWVLVIKMRFSTVARWTLKSLCTYPSDQTARLPVGFDSKSLERP
jgi:hypothetical protein